MPPALTIIGNSAHLPDEAAVEFVPVMNADDLNRAVGKVVTKG